MGERVAQLYIDPLSADILLDGLRRAVRRIVRNSLPVTSFSPVPPRCSNTRLHFFVAEI